MSINTGKELPKVMEERYFYFEYLTEDIARVHAAYAKRKQANGVMDFDDLLNEWLLRENEEARNLLSVQVSVHPRRRISGHQPRASSDLDRPARRPRTTTSWSVGDDSQSIYPWRGAHFCATCFEFPERHQEDTQVYKIETNHRSTPEILHLRQRRHRRQPRSSSAKQPRAGAFDSGMQPPCWSSLQRRDTSRPMFVAQARARAKRDEGIPNSMNMASPLPIALSTRIELQLLS